MLDSPLPDTLLDAARLAPSSHNTQPWLFQRRNGRIGLIADRTRALPVNDPDDRELTISCGCALMNLRVAAAARGDGMRIDCFPEADDPDLLAWLWHEGPVERDLAGLAEAIPLRHTHRKAFRDTPVDPDLVTRLIREAEQENALLIPLDSEAARHSAAALVMQGDAAQWSDRRWRRELAAWMHPRRKGDGLSLPGIAVPVAQMLVRSFDMGGGIGAKDAELAEASPLLAVLSTDGDTEAEWLAAGQALQRVLLTAVTKGVQASYLNQPIQVGELRGALRRLTGRQDKPQLLLRFGHPKEAGSHAPRRPLSDMVIA
ncbi:nitroreductase family protein [Thalassococcus sp. CAU 1522]|uniref:Nitroreductase family protein n=1 Tax=Thalassococcus arenae TaxID=2851652 RepID=A0ABS6N644_9RHOB|nr:nitroreductase family protein [Thalassococcus arenae]MBV2359263.1 nitroreductase family protein [Thalassococcus arenae]